MEELAHLALDYAQTLGATFAEARVQRDSSNATVLKNGNPEVTGFMRMMGMGVRVVVDGAMGFSSSNQLNRRGVRKTVMDAVSTAKASSKRIKKGVALAPERANRDRWDVRPKISPDSVGVEEKLGILLDLEKALSQNEFGVKLPTRLFVISDGDTEKTYVNSDGSHITSRVPRVSFSYMLTALKPGVGSTQRFGQKGESGGMGGPEGMGPYIFGGW